MFKYLKRIVSMPLAIGIICVSVIIIIGGIFAYNYFTKGTPPLVEWKTFRSDVYNYEIKYPVKFTVENTIDTDPDSIRYRGEDYTFSFAVFARNKDFLMERCLKDSAGNALTKTKEINGSKFYTYTENKIGTGGRMALIEGAIQNEYHAIHNNYCYYITYTIIPENPENTSLNETQNRFELLNQIFSTFKFTDKTTEEKNPIIETITPNKGPKGTIVEIKGSGLSGFEGDLDVYFEKADGKKIMLTDTFGDYAKTQDKLIKIEVVEPCQQGEKIYGRYSGIEAECNWVELTPGVYKVYVEFPWVKSNVVNFEITASDIPFIKSGRKYAEAKIEMMANGWTPIIPEIYETNSGLTKSANAIDSDFPEISYCGTGIDQICIVNFKKAEKKAHLNIQIGGRPPYGPYSEWTVIGNE